MKKLISIILLVSITLISCLGGCDTAVDDSSATPGGDQTSTPGTTVSPDTDTGTATAEPDTPVIPPGSLVLFTTLSGGTQSDFLRTTGGRISWDSTHYKFLRYVPDIELLDEFGWTVSKSYAKSYIYGVTAGDWVYEVRCSTDTGSKNISRLDPETGDTVGTFSSITTGNMYAGFTICGDTIYYRSKIAEDLFGRRTGGGHVMAAKIGGGTVQVLDYYDDNNKGAYYGIGNDLITVITTYEDDSVFYDIYRVNQATMAVGELLYSFDNYEPVDFFAGDTCLFWAESVRGTDIINIIKFPLSDQPYYFLEISETTADFLTVDESRGKVLITFKDSTPESPFYYLSDLDDGDTIELDIDSGFYSSLIHANGQFIILE